MKKLGVFHKNTHYFFARMLFLSALLLAGFSIISSVIIGYLTHKNEQAQLSKYYDMAAVSLLNACDTHYSEFPAFAGKLLVDNRCHPALMSLMQVSRLEDLSSADRIDAVALLRNLCTDNTSLRGFLLYSTTTHNLYYYLDTRAYLSYAGSFENSFDLTPYSGNAIGVDTIDEMLALCNVEDRGDYYGMTATLYKTPGDTTGYVIPLYATSEYTSLLSKLSLGSHNIYTITDSSGTQLYSSIYPAKAPDEGYTVSSLSSPRYHYTISYYVPKLKPTESYATTLIAFLTVLVNVFSFGLLYLTYYLTRKNISHILTGMNTFSIENLDYRIGQPKNRSEFSLIIDGFNKMCAALQTNVEKSYIYELQQKKSELYALQTSINPHFLYNTMEIIRSQILAGHQEEASQMILLLSRIYRTQTGTRMFCSLDQEIELCTNLIELYQFRFPNFDYEFEDPGTLGQYALPKNTLQPLIENYFTHGIDNSRDDNCIRLEITSFLQEDQKYIRMILSNNGHPISPEDQCRLNDMIKQNIYDSETAGFALTNVLSRMRIVFHEDCQLLISGGSDEMLFAVELIFPARSISDLQAQFAN